MSTVMDRIDDSKLNELGRARRDQGLRCFVFLDPPGQQFTALCLDLGLHARGSSVPEAQANLHEQISDLLDLASERGQLEELLNAPPSKSMEKLARQVMFAARIAVFIARVFHKARLVFSPVQYAEQPRGKGLALA